MNELTPFFEKLKQSFNNQTFVKITLSKPAYKSDGLHNIYVRLVTIKDEPTFSFTYHYQTNDQVKNYNLEEAITELKAQLEKKFRIAILFTLEEDFTTQISKKGKISTKSIVPSFTNKPPETHDKPRTKRATLGAYLNLLGVTDKEGNVIPKMADKFRQINKYLEIIEGLIKNTKLPNEAQIVDMGSGKGYLTFALYDYLVNQRKIDAQITGIEVRQELVDFCNETAKKCGFENLKFEAKPIEKYTKKLMC